MKVNGREVHFMRTVLATCEVARRCKDGDIKNIGILFKGATDKIIVETAHFMAALSSGYEKSQKFANPAYEEKPLTFEECMSLDEDTFMALFDEAQKVWAGEKPTVETVPVKEKGKKKEKAEQS